MYSFVRIVSPLAYKFPISGYALTGDAILVLSLDTRANVLEKGAVSALIVFNSKRRRPKMV